MFAILDELEVQRARAGVPDEVLLRTPHCLTKNLPQWVYSIDGGDGPGIISTCHCSSRVSSR